MEQDRRSIPHRPWDENEDRILIKFVKAGADYVTISKVLDRSAGAASARARELIKKGKLQPIEKANHKKPPCCKGCVFRIYLSGTGFTACHYYYYTGKRRPQVEDGRCSARETRKGILRALQMAQREEYALEEK